MKRIAVDTGGTFTDAVLVDDETRLVDFYKAPSTPGDYALGLLESIEPWESQLGTIDLFVHGTTVCLNAILQGRLGETALVTTRGFRDVIEIQRSNRTHIYDLMYTKPLPLVPRRLRFEVPERMAADGTVLEPLDEEAVQALIPLLADSGVEAVAVCLLNSYMNDAHERLLCSLVKESLPNVHVTASTDLGREYREYERSCTAVLNSGLMPIMSGYLDSLEVLLARRGFRNPLHIMQSNGGITTAVVARERPVQTIHSGVVGGVVAAATFAKLVEEENAIGTDMGGTSYDVSLIVGGSHGTLPLLEITTPTSGDGVYPLQVPTLDTKAIGAGGGSIAWIDGGGSIHVGPQSAGADPGPACYGRGGTEPTITDLNLVLGRLDPGMFLGGRMRIYPELATEAVAQLSQALGASDEDAASGVLAIAVNNMANAIKTLTVDRGIDPRGFTLIAAGGAGPLHASLIARELDIHKVIVPPVPGNFAAWGMLCTDLKHDFRKTMIMLLQDADPSFITSSFQALENEATAVLLQDGVQPEKMMLVRSMDLRYLGQGHSMEVAVPDGQLKAEDWGHVESGYDEMHLKMYSHNAPDEPKEIVALRLTAIGLVEKPSLPVISKGQKKPPACSGLPTRPVFLGESRMPCKVFDRSLLKANNIVVGPAVVEEAASTVLVLSGQQASVDRYGSLILADSEV